MIIRRATLRLTVLYSLVLLGIVAVFAIGVAIYVSVAFDLELPESSVSEEAIDRANAALRTGLIACFGVLVVLTPFISFLMARRALAPVRANMEAQQRFIDDASHELRTPIAVAQGELELALLRPRSAEEYQAAMTEALGALGELGTLTSDLLLLTGNAPLDAHSPVVSVQDVIDRALLAVSHELRARVTVAAPGSVDVRGSAELLVRAIANLLENADKFSPAGTRITIVVERIGDEVRVAVQDSGPGMTQEQVAAAFDRFWRADSSRSLPGRGIGLSIVRRIAELHGGRASLRSSPGHGTQAAIEIPALT